MKTNQQQKKQVNENLSIVDIITAQQYILFFPLKKNCTFDLLKLGKAIWSCFSNKM